MVCDGRKKCRVGRLSAMWFETPISVALLNATPAFFATVEMLSSVAAQAMACLAAIPGPQCNGCLLSGLWHSVR